MTLDLGLVEDSRSQTIDFLLSGFFPEYDVDTPVFVRSESYINTMIDKIFPPL